MAIACKKKSLDTEGSYCCFEVATIETQNHRMDFKDHLILTLLSLVGTLSSRAILVCTQRCNSGVCNLRWADVPSVSPYTVWFRS